jgi:cystathionine gamma-lyase
MTMGADNARLGTRAIHAGQRPDPATGAIMTPIYQTATYAQPSPGKFIEDFDYSRSSNPTRKALEANLASLEGGKFGLCFGSGCAAMDCVLHQLKPGDHVILCDDVYGGTNRLFNRVYDRHGIRVSLVDLTDHDAARAAFMPETRLVWLETPTNPMLKVIDIGAMAELCRAQGALLAVDNTFATPVLQNPLSLGADIVCHSSTKYIGGHSDVVGGALVTSDDELHEKLKFVQNSVGAVPGPMDCFLLLRSTKTIHVRVDRHCQNALRVAEYLEESPRFKRVIYPGLKSHPQHAVAMKQMSGYGGMITAEIDGGLEDARRFLERLTIFSIAESLGGVESLIEAPAIMTHASVPPEQRTKLGISDGLVRFSVGIEDVDDLIGDIERALG